MNNLFRMRELIELINDADKAYFGEDKPIMTDKEYDALVEELTKIEKETGIHTIKPANPFLVTPAGIAMNCIV